MSLARADINNSLWIIPHLQAIADQSDQPNLTRDVLEACRTKQAFLFLSKTGFLVVKPLAKADKKQLLLWVAWCRSKHPEYHINELEYLGRLIEVDELVFYTKRKGFRRLGPKLGFEMAGLENDFTIWSKAL